MPRLECDYCGNEIDYHDPGSRPDRCPKCDSSLGHLQPVDITADSVKAESETPGSTSSNTEMIPDGLTLKHQAQDLTLKVEQADRVVLGRGEYGADILRAIPQISRTHCEIVYEGGQYLVTDCSSSHGTFVGAEKIDCKKQPRQALQDQGLLFLGREPFLVTLDMTEKPEEPKKLAGYECGNCGHRCDSDTAPCRECMSMEWRPFFE